MLLHVVKCEGWGADPGVYFQTKSGKSASEAGM